MSVEDKEDLDMPNHLSGKVRRSCSTNYFLTVRTLYTPIPQSSLQIVETVFETEL